MPQLSIVEQSILANDLQTYMQSLGNYQAARSLDPGYDVNQMNSFITDATGGAALLAAGNMAANFASEQTALASLNNVISKAAAYVTNLQAQVATWNKVANIGAAVGGLIGSFGSGNPVTILGAADALAQAIRPGKKADPNDPNGL